MKNKKIKYPKLSVAMKKAMLGNKNALGYKRSEKEREAIRERMLGNRIWKGRAHSDETKRKLSKSHKGKTVSSVTRARISKAKVGKRLQLSGAERERRQKAFSGSNNPMWQGGVSYGAYPLEFNPELKRLIKKRDGNKCVLCETQTQLCVHHINYINDDCCSDNLVTLCRGCHQSTNFDKDFWRVGFQKFMKRKGA